MSNGNDQTEDFKRATASTMRALSGEQELEVRFTNEAPGYRGLRARVPQPLPDMAPEELAILRGAADRIATRLRYHDDGIHARFLPNTHGAAEAFEALEQVRCEAKGAEEMSGVGSNLAALSDHRLREAKLGEVSERKQVPMAEALRLYVREILTGRTPPADLRSVVDLWRPWIDSRLGDQVLADLKGSVGDQARYAQAVRDLLGELDMDIGADPGAHPENPDPDGRQDQSDQEQGQAQGESADDSGEEGESFQADSVSTGEDESAEGWDEGSDFRAETEGESPAGEDERPWQALRNARNDLPETDYKVYTTKHDEIVGAEDLCDSDELTHLRRLLDHQLSDLKGAVTRLANRLQRRLLAKQRRHWMFDLEEGTLDSARLARVVTNPLTPLSFKKEKEAAFRDTVVTLLLDNSGSMRGRPITIAALSADILARTLERCQVKVEILGFTTREWKGGKSKRQWQAEGKPKFPGRLNDIRHIIYKGADAPWRRTRRNLGLMLKEGLLKENIDGDALMWAHQRLMMRPEQRRILMVISDGAPLDETSINENGASYLDRHLRDVIAWIEKRGQVELTAIGIGHDVTRYYSRAVTIHDAKQLGDTMMDSLAQLFDEQGQGARPAA